MAFVNVIAIGIGGGGSEPSESNTIFYTVNVNGQFVDDGNFNADAPLTQFNITVE